MEGDPVGGGGGVLGLGEEELEHGGRVRHELAGEPAARRGVHPGVPALVLHDLLGEHSEQLHHGGVGEVPHPREEAVHPALGSERQRRERQGDLREQPRRAEAEPPRREEERVEEVGNLLRRGATTGGGGGALDLPPEHLRGEEEQVGGRGRVARGRRGQQRGGHPPRLRRPLKREEPLVGREPRRRVVVVAAAVVERVHRGGEPRPQLRRLRVHRGGGGEVGRVDSVGEKGEGEEGTEGIGPSGRQRTDERVGWDAIFFLFYFSFRLLFTPFLGHFPESMTGLVAPLASALMWICLIGLASDFQILNLEKSGTARWWPRVARIKTK